MQEKKDVIRALRTQIDEAKKKNQKWGELQQKLADFYSRDDGIQYDSSALLDYLDDYFLNDVYGAIELIRAAIIEDYVSVANALNNRKLLPGKDYDKKYARIESYINKAKEIKAIENQIKKRNEYYLGLDEANPCVYRLEDAEAYAKEWLQGANAAKEYVERVIREDITKLENIYYTLDKEDEEKLLKLMTGVFEQEEDLRLLASLKYKKQLRHQNELLSTKATSVIAASKVIATILNDANNFGCLLNLIDEMIFVGDAKHSDHVEAYHLALGHLEDSNALAQICIKVTKGEINKITRRLFNFCLSETYQKNVEILIHALGILREYHQNDKNNPEKHVPTKLGTEIIKLDKDITLDYYHSSISKNAADMIDLAFNSNPRMFKELFIREVSGYFLARGSRGQYPADEFYSKLYESRKLFFTNLMQDSNMQAFTYYKDCANQVNKTFELKLPLTPVFVVSPKSNKNDIGLEDFFNNPTGTLSKFFSFNGSNKTNDNNKDQELKENPASPYDANL